MQPRFFLVIRNIKKFPLEKEGTFHLIYLTACARISTATSIMAYLIIVRGMRLLCVLQSPLEWPTMVMIRSICFFSFTVFGKFYILDVVLSRCFKAIKMLNLENISFCLVLHLL